MTNHKSGGNRGRPKGSSGKDVPKKLIAAAEQLLRDADRADITERRIAAVAGVHERMIHYYFGDKNGLLFQVVSAYLDGVTEQLEAIDTTGLSSRDAVRLIIKTFVEAYYNKPWVGRFAVSEMAVKGSSVRESILNRYGLAGQAVQQLRRHFAKMAAEGEYHPDAEQWHNASTALIMLIGAPLSLQALPIHSGMSLEEFKSDAWINYLADLFDSHLRHPAARDASQEMKHC